MKSGDRIIFKSENLTHSEDELAYRSFNTLPEVEFLTNDKTYIIYGLDMENYVSIVDDMGVLRTYYKKWFIPLEDQRNKKLSDLGI